MVMQIIYNNQDMETTQVSIDAWIYKENVIYTYNGIYAATQKRRNLI